ncbi:MAG: hypothetical protein AAFO80_16845 [Pseudomonadota bacterium]
MFVDSGVGLLLALIPFFFILWVVLSVVTSLKRIAGALERLVDKNGFVDAATDVMRTSADFESGSSGGNAYASKTQAEREARDPAYKYIPRRK